MSCFTTNMLNLLEDTQKAVRTEARPNQTLRSVQKVTIGPNRNPISFPVISILPVEEAPYQILNGGKIDNRRRLRIEVYSHKIKTKDSMRASMGILENIKNIFRVNAPNWQLPSSKGGFSTVYDTVISEITPGNNPAPYRNGFISVASMDMDCYSRDNIHDGIKAVSVAEMIECDGKSLVDIMTNTFKEYKTGVSNVLSSTKSFKSFTLPPNISYPVVFIGISSELRDHTFTGRDEITRNIEVHILHQMADYQKSLKKNVELADYCRQIFFANKHLAGRAAHFDYKGILYGQLGIGGHLLYGSTVNFQIQSYEVLPGT